MKKDSGSNKHDINYSLKCQQNKHPLLFLDRILNIQPGVSATGLKNYTYAEWYFPSHFQDDPNVPGFIQIETLVQTFIMTFLSLEEYSGMKTNFISANNVKFKRKIIPGDTLIINSYLNSFKRGLAKGYAESFVDNSPACRADFIISLPDVLNRFKPKNSPV